MTWSDKLEIGLKENAFARKAEPGAAGGESRGCSEDGVGSWAHLKVVATRA